VIRFGVFELNLDAAELRKQGVRLQLQPKQFQMLAVLLERPGEVVTRDELRRRLWDGDTFVDYESGLNTAANRLRHDHCTGRHPAANRTYALYLKLKAHAEPIPPPKLVIDSTRSLPVTVTRCLNHLTQQPTRAAWPTRPQPASTT